MWIFLEVGIRYFYTRTKFEIDISIRLEIKILYPIKHNLINFDFLELRKKFTTLLTSVKRDYQFFSKMNFSSLKLYTKFQINISIRPEIKKILYPIEHNLINFDFLKLKKKFTTLLKNVKRL